MALPGGQSYKKMTQIVLELSLLCLKIVSGFGLCKKKKKKPKGMKELELWYMVE